MDEVPAVHTVEIRPATPSVAEIFAAAICQKKICANVAQVVKKPTPRLKQIQYGEVLTTDQVVERLQEAEQKRTMTNAPKKNTNTKSIAAKTLKKAAKKKTPTSSWEESADKISLHDESDDSNHCLRSVHGASLSTGGSKMDACNLKTENVVPAEPSKCTWHKEADPTNSPHTKKPLRPLKKIHANALETVGRTPIIRLNKIPQSYGIKCEVLVKCEYFNPGGSVKDRIAVRMIDDAEALGKVKPGATIIEPSSGNTGIGLAMVCAIKGYKCVVVMPEKMSQEKVDTLEALGAKVVRTPTDQGSYSRNSTFLVSHKLQEETPNSIILNQYKNASNPLAHYDTTAAEIYEQCDGKIDMVVGGSGTGGTISGIARRMKEINPSCKIVCVDPVGSILARPDTLNVNRGQFWEVEGIGYDFVPTTLDRSVIDEWIKISDQESMPMAKRLIREEGLLCGGSSGAHVAAAMKAAAKLEAGQRCVIILPDSIRNYLSKFVSDAWMEVRHLQPCVNSMNYWWWENKVSKLTLDPPISILGSVSCRKTLNLLRKLGINEIPVCEENGKFLGIAMLAELFNKFMARKIKPDTHISNALRTKFIKIKPDATLGVVSKALHIDGFVVLMEDNEEGEEQFAGLITIGDLLQYIM
ncbi:cystathionine beta-synthase [Holotrichia oblita]|uniref:Cystathionine beta-synthase n=1 Tax=Holotrichia oblita TaxID=644536 RepID=A0ACB9TQY4_HOLOL|nr:cystathionine beta-synthase [Holotrichia oblita]